MSAADALPPTRILSVLLGVGLAVQVVGFIVAVLAVPRTELEVPRPVGVGEGDLVAERGDLVVMMFGLLGFGLGGVLSLTAVVGFGVLLGLRAHGELQP